MACILLWSFTLAVARLLVCSAKAGLYGELSDGTKTFLRSVLNRCTIRVTQSLEEEETMYEKLNMFSQETTTSLQVTFILNNLYDNISEKKIHC